jgi:hypothetical protein
MLALTGAEAIVDQDLDDLQKARKIMRKIVPSQRDD